MLSNSNKEYKVRFVIVEDRGIHEFGNQDFFFRMVRIRLSIGKIVPACFYNDEFERLIDPRGRITATTRPTGRYYDVKARERGEPDTIYDVHPLPGYMHSLPPSIFKKPSRNPVVGLTRGINHVAAFLRSLVP